MATSPQERRLAAILAADVVGYSALVERDEAGTLARLTALRTEVIEPLLAQRHGRLVKLLGDGLLAEFASVVDAVACALAVQERGTPDLALRIGINLGDVVVDGDDLYGDGVNIAARLEGLAEPGGIVVSGTAYDHLHGQPGFAFACLGEQRLKNIARPVRAYRLLRHGTPSVAMPVPTGQRPSIAVLPFDNLSGDPGQTYFSDGIAEDLITELSRSRDLVVIARHTSFSLRGQALDAAELGRRLGVRYLLEGSVRRSGDRVRITVQLIDASTAAHLWANRYDRELADLFTVQDEVVATIAATLPGRIQAAAIEHARRKAPVAADAYDLVLRGLDHLGRYGEGTNRRAREMFEQAAALDPGYPLAKACLALTIYVEEYVDAKRLDSEELRRALALAREAVALDPDHSRCQRILADICLPLQHYELADLHSARALFLNPNDADAAVTRAYVLMYLGRASEAVGWMEKAIGLNPLHPNWYSIILGRALHYAGRHREALDAYLRIERPQYFTFAYMAACEHKLDHSAQAAGHVARTLALQPGFSAAAWLATLPFRDTRERERIHAEFVAAGFPL